MGTTAPFLLLVLVFCLAFYTIHLIPGVGERLVGYTHALHRDLEYPPFVPWLSRFTVPLLGEIPGILILLITLIIAIPATLIERGYGTMAGVAYLLGAGGLMLMVDTIALAQGVIQILMLLALGNPVFYFLFAAFGPLAHREWLGAFVLTFIFDVARRKDARIFELV